MDEDESTKNIMPSASEIAFSVSVRINLSNFEEDSVIPPVSTRM